jgi:hypothetical protein
VYGANRIWGVFPTPSDDVTYAAYYDLSDNDWHELDESDFADYMECTGATFQWVEDSVLYVVGSELGSDVMYWYSMREGFWENDDDIPFNFGSGACIAYLPNASYAWMLYPIPGWIYCCPGNSSSFYRYAIPSSRPGDAELYGFYPGPNAIIADQTPQFLWSSSAAAQYRIQVSTDPSFTLNEIDEVVPNPEYEPTTKLANATYYWRTAAWIGGAWSWGANSHSFVLDGGWQQLRSLPSSVGAGATMAYDVYHFGHQSILLVKGGGFNPRGFYEYVPAEDTWYSWDDVEYDPVDGTSLTTFDAAEEQWSMCPMLAFGDATHLDYPFMYSPPPTDRWDEWISEEYGSRFPVDLGPGASMAAGIKPYMYLIVGEDDEQNPRNNFYRVDPPEEYFEGGEGVSSATGNARAHVVTRYDGIEVEYQLPATARVRATLHDAVGRQVGVLDVGEQQPGVHRLTWGRDREGGKLSAGAYFVLLDMGTQQAKLKAIVR